MQLESVKALKQELLHEIVIPVSHSARIREASLRNISISEIAREILFETNFATAARNPDIFPGVQRSIALGIAPYRDEFRLAVRVQRPALLNGALVKHIIKEAKGEVDIRVIGRVDKRTIRSLPPWHQANTRPLLIGSSVGHINITAGTLGAFVSRAGRPYILSNNHVLADEDRCNEGDPILQRGRFDGGMHPQDQVATLRYWVSLNRKGANRVDAALAEIDDGVGWEPTLLRSVAGNTNSHLAGIGPDFLDEGVTVYKIGRTTGPTEGRVVAFDFDELVVNFDTGNLRFDGQIEIQGVGDHPFSDGGDSGSLIVDSDMQAIALLFAGSDTGGANGQGLTYATPIRSVLEELQADLLS